MALNWPFNQLMQSKVWSILSSDQVAQRMGRASPRAVTLCPARSPGFSPPSVRTARFSLSPNRTVLILNFCANNAISIAIPQAHYEPEPISIRTPFFKQPDFTQQTYTPQPSCFCGFPLLPIAARSGHIALSIDCLRQAKLSSRGLATTQSVSYSGRKQL